MHQTQQIAKFALRASYNDLSDAARAQLKLHILDTLGCALGALGQGPIPAVQAQVRELGSSGACTLIGAGTAAIDRATLWNGALVRYLDFMDNYLAPQQTGHPCDTFAAVLAAAELSNASGKDFLAALAVAYQVFARMLEEVPVQEHGFDHTVQLTYAITAGVARALQLDAEKAAHALALAGATVQGLVVTRADYLSNWKGLQSAHVAQSTVNATFLARHGVTGPLQILDGKEGFSKAFGQPLQVDWSHEDLERITRTSLKSYNCEVHTQPAVEATLELRRQKQLDVAQIKQVDVAIFKQAYDITGSGEEAGDKYDVHSKEQADHSLPYLVAVALLDDEVTPRQFSMSRICAPDVQELLRRVRTLRDDLLTQRYPEETPCRVVVQMQDGTDYECVRNDWAGFFKRPLSWAAVRAKFEGLAGGHAPRPLLDEIADTVAHLENASIKDLTALLGKVA